MTGSARSMSNWRRMRVAVLTAGVAGATLVLGVPGSATGAPSAAHATKLVGTFVLQAGKHTGKTAKGSYFRMGVPGGHAGYIEDGGSSYILLRPGNQGGLSTAAYEPQPSPAFNSRGDSLSGKIFKPQPFEGINFGASTQRTDPQTHKTVPIPVITVRNGKLSGNLSAISVSWNKQQFNQGSPKPGGSYSGHTSKVTGTYNAGTHRFVLNWKSQIVGGPFNGFIGEWHFVGKFRAS